MTARQFAKHRETFCLASAGSDEEFRAYLSGFDAAVAIADLAAVPAQVRGKPLVWEAPSASNNWVNVARSVFGDYYIGIDGGRHSAWLEANVKPYENKIGDDVRSVIEAMMLAERDYEAKTCALVIEPHPDPRDEVIARLVEAVDALEMWDAARGYPVPYRIRDPLRAALAAAKAVQHG